jgi:AAA family ATP:ADP antiporter
MTGISVVAIPITIAWLFNGLWLGRKQEAMAAAETRV